MPSVQAVVWWSRGCSWGPSAGETDSGPGRSLSWCPAASHRGLRQDRNIEYCKNIVFVFYSMSDCRGRSWKLEIWKQSDTVYRWLPLIIEWIFCALQKNVTYNHKLKIKMLTQDGKSSKYRKWNQWTFGKNIWTINWLSKYMWIKDVKTSIVNCAYETKTQSFRSLEASYFSVICIKITVSFFCSAGNTNTWFFLRAACILHGLKNNEAATKMHLWVQLLYVTVCPCMYVSVCRYHSWTVHRPALSGSRRCRRMTAACCWTGVDQRTSAWEGLQAWRGCEGRACERRGKRHSRDRLVAAGTGQIAA